jgi:hypothetical protein
VPSFKIRDEFNLQNYMINRFFSSEKAEELSKANNKLKEEQRVFEKEFISKIKSLIIIDEKVPQTNNCNNGSLYNLYMNDYFEIDLILLYLEKKEDSGNIDCLINRIYEKYIHESIFYLPQLW